MLLELSPKTSNGDRRRAVRSFGSIDNIPAAASLSKSSTSPNCKGYRHSRRWVSRAGYTFWFCQNLIIVSFTRSGATKRFDVSPVDLRLVTQLQIQKFICRVHRLKTCRKIYYISPKETCFRNLLVQRFPGHRPLSFICVRLVQKSIVKDRFGTFSSLSKGLFWLGFILGL